MRICPCRRLFFLTSCKKHALGRGRNGRCCPDRQTERKGDGCVGHHPHDMPYAPYANAPHPHSQWPRFPCCRYSGSAPPACAPGCSSPAHWKPACPGAIPCGCAPEAPLARPFEPAFEPTGNGPPDAHPHRAVDVGVGCLKRRPARWPSSPARFGKRSLENSPFLFPYALYTLIPRVSGPLS